VNPRDRMAALMSEPFDYFGQRPNAFNAPAPQAKDKGAFLQSEKDRAPYASSVTQMSEAPGMHYSPYNGSLSPNAPQTAPATRSWMDLPGRAFNAISNLAPYESPTGEYRPGNFQHKVLPGLAHSIENGLGSAANAFTGQLPQYEVDDRGNTRTSEAMGKAALDAAGLAATGGIAAPKPSAAVQAFSNSREAAAPGAVAGAAGQRGSVDALNEALRPGLPMDHASRMQRARQMGFDTDTPYYHGTKATPFDEFKTGPEFTATGSKEFWRGDAVHMTPDKDYARMYGPNVGEYLLRKGNTLDFQRNGTLNPADKARSRDAFSTAKANGYDTFMDVGKAAPEVAVFEPKNIRSIDAAFDPSKAHLPGLLLSNDSRAAAPGIAMAGQRKLDPLGYYSKLDEVLGQLNPSDVVTTQTLAQRGVKQSELQARGLGDAFGNGGVKVGDLRAGASEPVGLKEVNYGASSEMLESEAQRNFGRSWSDLSPRDQGDIGRMIANSQDRTKFPSYSIDGGSNPTYRETVLSLPLKETAKPVQLPDGSFAIQRADGSFAGNHIEPMYRYKAAEYAQDSIYYGLAERGQVFRQGHFEDIPNAIAHMRSSMQKDAQGRPVYHLDELQSDWGQKLRDGGVRDEAKIVELSSRIKEMEDKWVGNADLQALDKQASDLSSQAYPMGHNGGRSFSNQWEALQQMAADPMRDAAHRELASDMRLKRREINAMYEPTLNLMRAELRTAQAGAPGHPLVNTTDQWSGTALRRALMQAVDSGAEGFAIPSGKTVQGYGMHNGQETAAKGMDYAYDKMYPSAFGKEIAKLDPSVKRHIMELMGHEGKPTSYWPITDKVREEVRKGLPLFSNQLYSAVPGIGLSGRDK
jgi:hypothetical protein